MYFNVFYIMPKGLKGFQKGNREAEKKGKNKATLKMEERRAVFDEEISQVWVEKIKELPATYVADQFMGKATDKIDLSGQVDFIFNESKLEPVVDKVEQFPAKTN